jgi:transcriptional regulator with XRE-family HTH domain
MFYLKLQLNAMKLQGSIVKKTREEKGYKQCYLAYLIGISQSHLSKIESDKAVVTVPELVKIAGSLEKPIAFFVS